ncbi:hypothetical protein T492DRAFT_977903 [Pavlovales sp. CCMP2436]|nr:hypothetical protein T492DRAFT_977903 [Pavlovales sp. CCMP2436]|mmetsp:Transcript_20075/g.50284  ORF Transcript_20075/g.50284 Transcript_20075/m.50284 type:complete len:404 (+) Transcript_20075:78-1289(+)
MLSLLKRCGRRGVPQVARTRSFGFFSDLRKKVGEELSKNEGLQQSLKELREHDAVKGARVVAKRAEDALKQAKVKAGELAQEAQIKASEVKQSVAENEHVKRAQAARDTAAEVARAASVSASSGSQTGAGTTGAGGAAEEGSTPAAGGVFSWLRTALSEKPAESTAGPRAPGEDNTDETAVIIKPPSMWEQAFNKANDSPLLGGLLGAFRGIFSGVGNVSGAVGDRVFGENENAESMAVLKERDPAFRPQPFIDHLEQLTIPHLVKAYLAGSIPDLRAVCADAAYSSLHSNIQARMAQQLFMDRRILDISHVELVGFRLVNEEPTAVVQFQTQQVNCVRNMGGVVVDGAEDDIRSVYYVIALQQHMPDPEKGADITEEPVDTRPSVDRWVVTEVAIRGAMQTW